MAEAKPDEIVSGGAKGPDLMGERIAADFGIPVRQFIPVWERPDGTKNKGAGFIRNGDMLHTVETLPYCREASKCGILDIDPTEPHGQPAAADDRL